MYRQVHRFCHDCARQELSGAYPEIDLVTTPQTGGNGAFNNCTSDYDAWIGLFRSSKGFGFGVSKAKLYDTFLSKALGVTDCGSLLSYGYISGEHIAILKKMRPMFIQNRTAILTANFSGHIYSPR